MRGLSRFYRSVSRSSLTALCLIAALPAEAMPPVEQARLVELEAGFRDGARHDQIWTNTWGAIYGGSAVAYGLVSRNASDADDRFDARVSAVKSALALGNLFLNPQPHRPALQRYRENTAANVQRLGVAETLRQELAIKEHERRNLQARVLPFAVNLAAGLTIGVVDDRPEDGAVNFTLGMLVNEIAIRTQPDAMSGFGNTVTVHIGQQPVELSYRWLVTPDSLALSVFF